jgi:hypothetical protein
VNVNFPIVDEALFERYPCGLALRAKYVKPAAPKLQFVVRADWFPAHGFVTIAAIAASV